MGATLVLINVWSRKLFLLMLGIFLLRFYFVFSSYSHDKGFAVAKIISFLEQLFRVCFNLVVNMFLFTTISLNTTVSFLNSSFRCQLVALFIIRILFFTSIRRY
jgi:hypothetical protein